MAQHPSPKKRWRWSKTRNWFSTRPCWGGFLLATAGLLVLIGPLSMQVFLFSDTICFEAWLVGSLLVGMGILSILAPLHALVTGSIGLLVSLASLFVAFGGYGIGVLLGLIGSSLCIAWRSGPPNQSK